METVTGAAHLPEMGGIDGCSIPTYAVPLESFARGFARMATGAGLEPLRAKAARRLIEACMAEPYFVAGTDRVDTRLMQAGQGRIFVKTGAEGVYCGAVPELGLGIAIKCDDGAGRASEAMVGAVLANLLGGDTELGAAVMAITQPVLSNWNRIDVGSIRATGVSG